MRRVREADVKNASSLAFSDGGEKQMNVGESRALWSISVMVVFLLAVMNAAVFMKSVEYRKKAEGYSGESEAKQNSSLKETTGKECPDSTGGEEEAKLKIKYFYSRYCPWCRREEPILKRITENFGRTVRIEWYDVGRCPEETEKYAVKGVPTMVFSTSDEDKEYPHYGFVPEDDLRNLVCEVTGSC